MQGCVELAFDFVIGEMLIENIAKQSDGNAAVRLGLKDIHDLPEQENAREKAFTKQFLARIDIGFSKDLPFGSDLGISFIEFGKAQDHGALDDRQKVFDIHEQALGQMVEVFFAAAIDQQLKQAADTGGHGMRKQLIGFVPWFWRSQNSFRPGHDFVDEIYIQKELRRFAVARMM